ncbi:MULTISPECIES: hypothetical protein [Lysinibacillus]|uniref:Uncharacterized protein n=1 Tax=Lysinibacillus fusiformis TaxID=28031 RepID=A0A2I0UVE1_9BACI|nr:MULTISPECIES: hypothetical protein [Lysinibacillus]KUF34856.1 hypothetical protein AK833_08855 [Lysinibacillus sp. F5]PKU50030.1 hypothetical protein CRI88_20825 [Lysinibacillus fusiformis]
MNKNEALNCVYENILGEHPILIQLRNGEGLNEDKYSELITAMKRLIVEYKSLEVTPKKLALSFVDISNYFYLNEDKYSLDKQNRIEDAVQEISQLANELFDC